MSSAWNILAGGWGDCYHEIDADTRGLMTTVRSLDVYSVTIGFRSHFTVSL